MKQLSVMADLGEETLSAHSGGGSVVSSAKTNLSVRVAAMKVKAAALEEQEEIERQMVVPKTESQEA